MARCVRRIGVSLFALIALLGFREARAALDVEGEFDAGCFASRDRSVDDLDRFRAAGPLVEWSSRGEAGRFIAMRPFWSRVDTADGSQTTIDALWPVFTYTRRGAESRWRFLTMLRHNFDINNPNSRRRFWLFPLIFSGCDAAGEGYFAFFPLGGSLHEFLGRDTINFVLFPLYCTSTMGDLRSTSILWPIFASTHSDHQDRFRLFPLYGKAVNRHTRTTKTFVLWPFWTHATYEDPPGSGFILFPLYGQMMLEGQSTRMILPPFFRYAHSDRLTRIEAPWPFFQYRSGLEDRLYVWPLWGYKRVGDTSSSFCAWPIVSAKRSERPGDTYERLRIMPVYYSDHGRRGTTETAFRQFWPLIRWERFGDERLTRVLSLWPLRRTEAVERNFAPLWTLYRHRSTADERETEFLWGLYRSRHGAGERSGSLFPLVSWKAETHNGGSREWSVLKGLVGRSSNSRESTLRLLYFMHFTKHHEDPTP